MIVKLKTVADEDCSENIQRINEYFPSIEKEIEKEQKEIEIEIEQKYESSQNNKLSSEIEKLIVIAKEIAMSSRYVKVFHIKLVIARTYTTRTRNLFGCHKDGNKQIN